MQHEIEIRYLMAHDGELVDMGRDAGRFLLSTATPLCRERGARNFRTRGGLVLRVEAHRVCAA